jgi:hypothetical protein
MYYTIPGLFLFLNDFDFFPVSGSFPCSLTTMSIRIVSRLPTSDKLDPQESRAAIPLFPEYQSKILYYYILKL